MNLIPSFFLFSIASSFFIYLLFPFLAYLLSSDVNFISSYRDSFPLESAYLTAMWLLSCVVGFLVSKRYRLAHSLHSYAVSPNHILRIYLLLLIPFISFLTLVLQFNLQEVRSFLTNRSGFGFYYVFCWNLLIIAQLYLQESSLWKRRPFLLAFLLIPIWVYLGSKRGILIPFMVMYSAYLDGRNTPSLLSWRSIKHFLLIASSSIIIVLIAFAIFLGESSESLVFTFTTYFDHIYVTQKAIDSGLVITPDTWFSSLWAYIPRFLYPDKPYVYGQLHLIEVLYPGALETGWAPAFTPWLYIYMSFGTLGVFALGFIQGSISGLTSRLCRPHNPLANILYVQSTLGIFLYPAGADFFLVVIYFSIVILTCRYKF